MTTELDEFKTEIFELLDRAEEALLQFDQLSDNESAPALYDEVFRAYHNIKGAAGMMEWNELQHHVHQLENVLMQSKQTSSIPKGLISWFLKGNDAARSIMRNEPVEFSYETSQPVSAPVATRSAQDLPDEFHAEVTEGLERISMTLIQLESGSSDGSMIDSLYRDVHSIKGACQLFGLQEASSLFHAMESSLEVVRKQPGALESAHASTLLLCLDLVNLCLKNPGHEDTKKEVEFMVKLLAPFSVEAAAPAAVKPAVEPAPKKIVAAEEQKPAAEAEKPDTTIRVQVSLLDRLMTLMGEMVLVRNQVLQYSNKTDDLEFLNLSQKLDVVTSELQEETMKTRMQPIGNVVTKFQRVVRDLSNSLNKKINLNLIGTETELDKTLIEAIKDPLTHIVRNSCDHGIETPEERRQSGKAETGTITIRAFHEGGQVVVDISDDGRGLARERILRKAIEKSVIDPSRAEKMSDREVHQLIFAPGFSTAEKVTNVSGRGVGMDVVKSNIEKIGGLVDVISTEGAGTHIKLKIPLTLAIVPAMIVRSGEDRFAIPQVKLVELVRVEKSAVETVQGRPVYRLRGNILPLIGLHEVLGTETPDSSEAMNIVVLNSEKNLFGLVVDEILDTADIVVKPLPRFLKPISIYSGATVLGDGKVAFIMDVLGISQKHLGVTVQDQESASLADSIVTDEEPVREFVIVKVNSSSKHGLPLSCVKRMEEFRASDVEYSGKQRVIRYRGGVLKLVSLDELLGYPTRPLGDHLQVIVTKKDDQLLGLIVDQIVDVLNTRDHLAPSVSDEPFIMGNLVTASEIIVVIDPDQFFEAPASSRSGSRGSRRILFVEDTDSIRVSLCQELRDNGYDVVEAVDGIDGLRKIADHRCGFDLIISDIEMPRMNGMEFAKKVRTISQLKSVPLVAFTTKNGSGDVQEAKAAGFSSYLEKGKGKLLPLLVSEYLAGPRKETA